MQMTQSDEELRQLYEACVSACADSMYRVAYRLTSHPTLARELVQETYLQAWKNLGKLKERSKLRSWMFSILRNQYTKLIRKESKAANSIEHIEQVPEQSGLSDGESDSAGLVQTALATLEDKHRLPLLLVSMEGMSVEEAAKILSVPRGTVLSRLSRGRDKLKAAILRTGYVA